MENTPTTNEVTLVKSTNERKQFLEFPYSHYRDDEYWIAPLLMEQKKLIDTKKNPFYDNADIGMFIIKQNDTICGRIAAIEDRRFNNYHDSKTGFFGFFECIDNKNAARLLVQSASGWLKDRGLTEMLGPTNPSMMDEIGILVNGFDHYPSVLMPYHKSYYDRLLRELGFEKEIDLYAFRVTREKVALDRMYRAEEIVRRRHPMLHIREIDLKDIQNEIQIVRQIFNEAWKDNWGFIPLRKEELTALAKDLKMILDPDIAHIAEIGGNPIAFSIALPDLNQALRQLDGDGRLLPTGIFKLLWHRRNINQIRTALMGVLPEYRGKGIDALLHKKAIEKGLRKGYDSSELSWVLETNESMVRVAERIGAHLEKTYRMYHKEL